MPPELRRTHSLVPGGASLRVSASNRSQYILHLSHYRRSTQRGEEIPRAPTSSLRRRRRVVGSTRSFARPPTPSCAASPRRRAHLAPDLRHISPHLAHISPISPPHLAHISPTSPQVVPREWIRMFSVAELQLVLGGSDAPLNVADWRQHATYSGHFLDTSETLPRHFRDTSETLPTRAPSTPPPRGALRLFLCPDALVLWR